MITLDDIRIGEVHSISTNYYADGEEYDIVVIDSREALEAIPVEEFHVRPERDDIIIFGYFKNKIYWTRVG